MNVETVIKLNRFQPREYQLPVIRALESGKRKVISILPRRAGKDVMAFNIMIRQALKRIGVYYYIFPTYSQGKKVIWDSLTNDGFRFIDYIPTEIIVGKNSQEMKITLLNGSLIQIIGSDNIDSIVGTNPRGCVFSEYALQSPLAYQFIRPILAANDGWALFISTPRGKNHLWELYNIAQHNPDWFAQLLTLNDTQHIPLQEIEREKAEGIMSDDLIAQEYYCSFDRGVEGSYYSKYLDRLRLKSQIGQVPYEPGFKVNTAWDLGVRDSTTIIAFQVVGQTIRLIWCYENSKVGLEHYINVLKQKEREEGWIFGKHIAPHDIKVREFTSGMSRIDKARQLGITFTIAPDLSVEDGIEQVRSSLSKRWIDEVECKPLIKALENYRQECDVKKKIYKNHPLHDWSSHFADCMRYLCISLPKTRDGLSPEELDKRYRQAVYGSDQEGVPAVFRTDLPQY